MFKLFKKGNKLIIDDIDLSIITLDHIKQHWKKEWYIKENSTKIAKSYLDSDIKFKYYYSHGCLRVQASYVVAHENTAAIDGPMIIHFGFDNCLDNNEE